MEHLFPYFTGRDQSLDYYEPRNLTVAAVINGTVPRKSL
jgi:hypothetical protein